MNTPTHLLVNAALLARPGAPARNAAVLAAALLPDLSIYAMWAWARLFNGSSEQQIWSVLHWSPSWQLAGAATNSIPVYLAVLLLAVAWRWPILVLFALSALLHIAFDFPVHRDDAHRHFWPFSDWRFRSPLSYWDPAHYGTLVGLAELGLAVILMAIIWRRFGQWWIRGLLVAGLASYIAVPLYFSLTHHGS